jgi:two-component system, cell cycle sensor histidine kinase and response regulator CckA
MGEEDLLREIESLRLRIAELEGIQLRLTGAEQALGESEKRFRLLYENVPLGYQSLDKNGFFLEVNQAWLDMLGYSRSEVIGKWCGDFFTDPYQEKFRICFPQFKDAGEIHGIEFEMVKKDGSTIFVAADGRIGRDRAGNFQQTHCILRDITEQRQMAQALTVREQQYRTLVENIPDLIVRYDTDLRRIYVNPAWEKAGGLSAEDVINVRATDILKVSNPINVEYLEKLRQVQETGTPQEIEFTWVNARGVTLYLHYVIVPEYDRYGKIVSVLAVGHDLTERRKAEEVLDRANREWEQTFNAVSDLVMVLDDQHRIVRANRAMADALGMADQVLIGNLCFEVVHGEKRPPVFCPHSKLLADGKEHSVELPELHPGRIYDVRTSPLVSQNGRIIGSVHVTRDITERKQAEDALRRLNRELRAISNCNQVLIRAVDEQTLLNEICRIICDEAGYRMAWVGYVEHDDSKTVRPVAWAGVEDEYLATANITWADTELGRGPSGTAVRSGESVCVQDFTTDPEAAPWRENALKRGYRSSIAMPLKDNSADTFGVLNIYSAQPNAFTPDEVRILEELAGDLAFGITVLRVRAERQRAENVMSARARLLEYSTSHSLDELLQATLDEVEELTRSSIGFYHFVEADQRTLCLQAWSTRTLQDMCTAEGKGLHYDLDEAGVWVDCVRERGPVIHNDYSALPHRKGMPAGHAQVIRELVVPVFRDDRLVGILGVGNKPMDYNTCDIETASLFADLAWDITERKRSEQNIALLNFALNNVSEAVFLTDENARFHFVNEESCRVLGYSRTELLGSTVMDIDADFSIDSWQSHWNELRSWRALTLETYHKTKDSHILPVEINAHYFEYGGRGYNLALARDITERKQAEQERVAHLRFMESMDRINRAMQATNDLEQTMKDVLEVVLSTFECDRAWLVYPCDPATATFRVQMERSRPEYAGTSAVANDVPVVPEIARLLQTLRASDGPVKFGPGSDHQIPPDMARRFNIRSQIVTAVYPKTDKPYAFGLHQCSYPRVWTPEEARLFQEIGRRLGDVLDTSLTHRNLRESEAKLAEAQRIAHVGHWERDFNSDRITLSEEARRILGLSPDEQFACLDRWNERLLRLIHPEDRPRTAKAVEDALQAGSHYEIEYRVVHPNGEVRAVHAQEEVTRDGTGRPTRALAIMQDISDRKRAEEALRQSEERYRILFEKAQDAIMIVGIEGDEAGRIVSANQTAADIHGYESEEFLSLRLYDLDTPECAKGIPERVERVLKGEWVREEVTHRRKDGSVFPLEISAGLIEFENRKYCLVIDRDITHRKKAELALLKSEEKFHKAFQNAPVLMTLSNIDDGSYIDVNHHFCAVSGFGREEAVGRTSVELGWVSPEDRQRLKEEIQGRGRVTDMNLELRTKDQRTVHCIYNGELVTVGDHQYLLSLAYDITDRKKAEEALRESEQRFRNMFQGHDAVMLLIDPETGKILDSNPSARRFYGYEASELLGMTIEQINTLSPDEVASERKKAILEERNYFVFQHRLATGELRDVEVHSSPIDFGDKQVLFSIVNDITERKAAEEALRQNEATLRSVLRAAPVGIGVVTNRIIKWTNEFVPEMTGYSQEELSGQSTRILYESDAEFERVGRIKYDQIRSTGAGTMETVWKKKDGSIIEIILSSTATDPRNPKDAAVVFSALDITSRNRAQATIREQNKFLNTLLESLTHPFYVVNVDDYTIALANSAAVASGVSRSATCYSSTHSRTVPCNDSAHPCPMEEVKNTGLPATAEHVHRGEEGESRNIEVHAYPILDHQGKVSQIIEYCLDVTARVQAQEAVREHERMLSNVLSTSPSGIAYFKARKLKWANNGMMDLFGYREDQKDELLGRVAQDFYESDDEQKRVREIFRAQIADGKPAQADARLRKKDGSIFIGNVSVNSPELAGAGEESTVIISDITARRIAEEERARLITAIEQAAETVVITDPEGTIQYANPAFYSVTGYTAHEAIGQNPRILKSGHHDKEFYEEMWATLIGGAIWRGRFINKKKDGTLFEEDATISPVKDASGKIVNYVAVKRDVTNEVLLQKQLIEAQKMEAVGTLAGGVAHDFNNLLQVVLGYSEILLMGKHGQSPEVSSLETIRKTAKDGADLVKGLLTFSRRVESKLRPCDLNIELRRIEKILKRTIPKMIKIEMILADDLTPVDADPVQLEQIVLNLSVNAGHAMPKKGRLTFSTQNVTFDEDYCRTRLEVKPGEYVLLKVCDTGHGMGKEVLDHIFEPFYTTKKQGEGTGLGLAIVYGIVKNHGGHIVCLSEKGRGTTFDIYFPALKRDLGPDMAMTEEMLACGNETILLVDDDEEIRNIVKKFLTRNGYKVLTADNGESGVKIYREKKDQIKLVVLDLIMPEVGGEQCLAEITEIDPSVRILIASGYAGDESTKKALELSACGFIEKPFSCGQLLRVIRGILDATGERRTPPGGLVIDAQPNHEGEGTVFTATHADSKTLTTHKKPDVENLPFGLRILVIDDREHYLKMIEAGLTQFGHTPFIASSGTKGLQMFRETQVDVVICDLGMPELDGWAVGKQIKEVCEEKEVPKIPFILLTGETNMADTDRDLEKMVIDCGVDSVLAKPVDIPELLDVIRRIMKKSQNG